MHSVCLVFKTSTNTRLTCAVIAVVLHNDIDLDNIFVATAHNQNESRCFDGEY